MSTPANRMRTPQSGGGGPQPEFHLRDFSGGQHTYGDREALQDQEMWWCENVLPKTAGNLANVPPGSIALATFTDAGGASPIYAMGFNIAATPYQFIVNNSGAGWIVNLNTNVATKIIASGLTQPYATQYSNTGILIIDPSGYWDYNVTTANTLTPWNATIIGATISIVTTSVTGGTQLKQILTAPGGTGAVFNVNYQVISVVINAAGTGYVVGDSLSLTDGNPTTPANIIVTAVGAGGAISGISLASGGSYPGPSSATLVATGPTGNTVSGGTGTGATFTTKIQAIGAPGVSSPGTAPVYTNNSAGFTLTTNGHGYLNFIANDETSTNAVITSYFVFASGLIGGTSIATYAGRVWLGSGRTVYVTSINSYNNFGGSGLSFTIFDSYLFNNITALCSANNYLYIFGVDSIDAVSNVTVSATTGLTSFTRINIIQGVGTASPASVFVYYRAVAFYDPSGFYILNGATPEKISERITAVVAAIQNTSSNNPVYGGCAYIQGELCATFSFLVLDNFSGRTPASRVFTALYFRGRWWMYSMAVANNIVVATPAFASVIVNNQATVYESGNPSGTTTAVYEMFGGAGLAAWIVRTRLWDGQSILREKQALNAAMAAVMGSTGTSGCVFYVDTELANGSTSTTFPATATAAYQLMVEAAQGGSSQYLGLTINGDGTDTTQVKLIALKGKTERSFME